MTLPSSASRLTAGSSSPQLVSEGSDVTRRKGSVVDPGRYAGFQRRFAWSTRWTKAQPGRRQQARAWQRLAPLLLLILRGMVTDVGSGLSSHRASGTLDSELEAIAACVRCCACLLGFTSRMLNGVGGFGRIHCVRLLRFECKTSSKFHTVTRIVWKASGYWGLLAA